MPPICGIIMAPLAGSRSPKLMSSKLLDGLMKPACSTLAATLWCTTDFWSSLTMSMPSSRWSDVWSSCGSDSRFSADSRVPLTKVPLDDLISRIHIFPCRSAQISACCRDSTLLSKKPFIGVGTVLTLVWRPIRSVSGEKGTEMVFRSKVPFSERR